MPRKLTDGFEFTDLGRTFTCTTEACRADSADTWWWFRVSSERQPQRFAPFRAAPTDTQENVRERVVRYYDDLLVQRAAPVVSRWGNRGRGRPAAATPPVVAAADTPPVPQVIDGPLVMLGDGDNGASSEPVALL